MPIIIHALGIVVKYIFLNMRAFIQFIQKRNAVLTLSELDTVVFTHNLGGGTEKYVRNNFYKENILIVRLISYRRDAYFLLEHLSEQKILRKKDLFSFLDLIDVSKLTVNSLCAYSKPKDILNYVVQKSVFCKVAYLVHDFNAVCPTTTFVVGKKFCHYDCSHCSFGGKKIGSWQSMWDKFLSHAHEIVCFSESSKQILCKFYAGISAKITVVPHSMNYCTFTPIKIDGTFRNIAVVGNCSNIPKGKLVIKKLVRAVKKEKKRKLYIVGKAPFFFHRNSRFVCYTGAYELKILPEILTSGQIGVIVFTSILPETFSYAVSEFMKLGLYIVSLDIGAQGEKLHGYDKTVFVPNLEPESILAGVEKCFI